MTIDQNNVFNVDELHHEVLMQLEAIIFASDAPVSLARLKEAFQNQYSKQQLQQYLQQLSVLQHGRSIELIETAQGYRFQVRAKYRNMIAQVCLMTNQIISITVRNCCSDCLSSACNPR